LDIAPLVALAPPESGLYRAEQVADSSSAAVMIAQKLIGSPAQRARDAKPRMPSPRINLPATKPISRLASMSSRYRKTLVSRPQPSRFARCLQRPAPRRCSWSNPARRCQEHSSKLRRRLFCPRMWTEIRCQSEPRSASPPANSGPRPGWEPDGTLLISPATR
jgi:hypothetical protein